MRVSLLAFAFWVLLGKTLRYAVLLGVGSHLIQA